MSNVKTKKVKKTKGVDKKDPDQAFMDLQDRMEAMRFGISKLDDESSHFTLVTVMMDFLDEVMSEFRRYRAVNRMQQVLDRQTQTSFDGNDGFGPQTRKGRRPVADDQQPGPSGLQRLQQQQQQPSRLTPVREAVENIPSPRNGPNINEGSINKRKKKKSKKKQNKPRKRPEALLISDCTSEELAKLLKEMKQSDALKSVGETISKVRRAQNGGMLLELKQGSSASAIAPKVKEAVKGKASVRTLAPSKMIEIMHLDEITTPEEVAESVKAQLNIEIEIDRIKMKKGRAAGTQWARINVSLPDFQSFLNLGKLKVGWSICHIREVMEEQKCYKCWKVGHTSYHCREPDRSNLCWKCGLSGHKKQACTNSVKCLDCGTRSQNPHATGSYMCPRRRTIR